MRLVKQDTIFVHSTTGRMGIHPLIGSSYKSYIHNNLVRSVVDMYTRVVVSTSIYRIKRTYDNKI